MTLTAPERMELERRVASCRGGADEARRARCILLATAGMAWAEIRTLLHCRDSYIARWTAHFGHRDHSDRSIVISEIGGS